MFRMTVVVILLAVSGGAAFAQEPAETLKKCLADNTTGKDRKDLAKWVFLGMAAHPELKPYVNNEAANAADESARTLAMLVTRLLTEYCPSETRAAAKPGTQGLQLAMTHLGELAMLELIADPSVSESMRSFIRYVDQQRLLMVLSPK